MAAGALRLCGKKRTARACSMLSQAAVIIPSVWRNGGAFGPVIREFRATERAVWLTIDDGPDGRATPRMLDLLAEYDAKASFFCVGQNVDAHRDVCRRIVEEGHGLENHTWSHPAGGFWCLPPALMEREISWGNRAVETAVGKTPRFFRSPAGMTNPFVHPVLAREGLRLVGWSAAGFDGTERDVDLILGRLRTGIRPGAIILLHAPRYRGDWEAGRVEVLKRLLEVLREQGMRTVLPEDDSLLEH